jgi:hypothetical protein
MSLLQVLLQPAWLHPIPFRNRRRQAQVGFPCLKQGVR